MTTFSTHKDSLAGVLREIFKTFMEGEEFYNRLGVVESINEQESTCVVRVINGDRIEDVRLQQVKSSGMLMIPSESSAVMVGWSDKTTAFISLYSQIDRVEFQDGSNGGLIIIQELTNKINELVASVNEINSAIKTHTHTSGGSGSPTTAPIGYTVGDAVEFTKEDYENTNFTH